MKLQRHVALAVYMRVKALIGNIQVGLTARQTDTLHCLGQVLQVRLEQRREYGQTVTVLG